MSVSVESLSSSRPAAGQGNAARWAALSRRGDWLAMVVVALFAVGVVLAARSLIMDDALITFRVAENLARGRGFVYNIGERTLVTTTPLYTLLLAPGIWLLGTPFRASFALHLVSAVTLAVSSYQLGRASGCRLVGIIGALLLALCPLLVMAFSMESYLYVALIVASLWAYCAGRYRLAALLLGTTALTRGDGIILGVCVLGHYLITRRRIPLAAAIIFSAVVGTWYLFATLYFGSPFPLTLSAKMAQGQANWLRILFLEGLWRFLAGYYKLSWLSVIFVPCIALGLLYVLLADRRWLILVAYTVLYTVGYILLKVPPAEWYYAPLAPGLVLLAALGVGVFARSVAWTIHYLLRRTPATSAWFPLVGQVMVAGAVGALLLIPEYRASARTIAEGPEWKAVAYPVIGRWIRDNTAPTVSLATIDIGHLGYYSQRRIIDMAGLVQPDVATHVAHGDFGYAIRTYHPDLVLLGRYWLLEVQGADWFRQSYVELQQFHSWATDTPFVLFGRREGVKIQPQTFTITNPLEINFASSVTLLGYNVDREKLAPGETLELTLFWRCERLLPIPYTVFTHLLSSDQTRLWGGKDNQPQDGHYPTTAWQPGETIVDRYLLPVDPATPPGEYLLEVGLYNLDTGERLPVLDENGAITGDRALLRKLVVSKLVD
jgi:hypothetical protein